VTQVSPYWAAVTRVAATGPAEPPPGRRNRQSVASPQGWLYMAFILGAYSRMIVGSQAHLPTSSPSTPWRWPPDVASPGCGNYVASSGCGNYDEASRIWGERAPSYLVRRRGQGALEP
jgi:hypothetical protein